MSEKTPASALDAALRLDISSFREPIIYWDKDNIRRLAVVDLDVVDPQHALSKAADLHSLLGGNAVTPSMAWVTKSGGLRLAFVEQPETDAQTAALLWYVLARPKRLDSFRLEIKTDSRHPRGGAGDPSLACGPIFRFTQSVRSRSVGKLPADALSEEEWKDELAHRGLEYGRYASAVCPIDGCRDRRTSHGNDPIVISEKGMHCFRCNRHAQPSRAEATIGRTAPLIEAASTLVNAEHAIAMIQSTCSDLNERDALLAWRGLIKGVYSGTVDPQLLARIEGAGKVGHFPFLRDEHNRWLHVKTLQPTVLSRETLKRAPFVGSPADVDMSVATGPIPGFTTLSVQGATRVPSPLLDEADKPLPLKCALSTPFAPGPAPDSKAMEEAVRVLEEHVHGFDADAAGAILLASFVAQIAKAPPPFVILTGPTGAGKTATVDAAGCMLGGSRAKLALTNPSKDFARSIGLAIEGGASILHAEEIGRGDVRETFGTLLALDRQHRFDSKGSNERSVAVTAPIVLTGSALPKLFRESVELNRRAIVFELMPKQGCTVAPQDVMQHPTTRSHATTFVRAMWHATRGFGDPSGWRDFALSAFSTAKTLADLRSNAGGDQQADALRCLYDHYRIVRACGGFLSLANDDIEDVAKFALCELELDLERMSKQAIETRVNELNAGDVDTALGLPPKESVKLIVKVRGGLASYKFDRRHAMRGTSDPASWSAVSLAKSTPKSLKVAPTVVASSYGSWTWSGPCATHHTILHRASDRGVTFTAVLLPNGTGHYWEGDAPPDQLLADHWSSGPRELATIEADENAAAYASLGKIVFEIRPGLRYLGVDVDSFGQTTIKWDEDDQSNRFEDARRALGEATASGARRAALVEVLKRGAESLSRATRDLEEELDQQARREMATHRAINTRGIYIDKDFVDTLHRLIHEGPRLLAPGLSDPKTHARVKSELVEVKKSGRLFDLFTSGRIDAARFAELQALELEQSSARSWVAKIRAGIDADGRLRETLRLHGAKTGRWTARRGRVHNLPKSVDADGGDLSEARDLLVVEHDLKAVLAYAKSKKMSLGELVEATMRRAFSVPSGRLLVQADYGQIEPRVLAWLSRSDDVLEHVRSGGDIYRRFAAMIFAKTVDSVSSEERDTAKKVFVPLCYSAGLQRIKTLLVAGDPKIADAEVMRVIDLFRHNAQPQIEFRDALWDALLKALDTGENTNFGHVIVERDERNGGARIWLATGRTLFYGTPRIENNDLIVSVYGGEVTLHPGLLLQNVTQAIARDILANALIRLEEEGIGASLHVHDEVLAEVDNDRDVQRVVTTLEEPHPSLRDLPLAVKIRVGKSFS